MVLHRSDICSKICKKVLKNYTPRAQAPFIVVGSYIDHGAHDIGQTCSSPKARFMIIKYQGQFARDVKDWLTIAVSITSTK